MSRPRRLVETLGQTGGVDYKRHVHRRSFLGEPRSVQHAPVTGDEDLQRASEESTLGPRSRIRGSAILSAIRFMPGSSVGSKPALHPSTYMAAFSPRSSSRCVHMVRPLGSASNRRMAMNDAPSSRSISLVELSGCTSVMTHDRAGWPGMRWVPRVPGANGPSSSNSAGGSTQLATLVKNTYAKRSGTFTSTEH